MDNLLRFLSEQNLVWFQENLRDKMKDKDNQLIALNVNELMKDDEAKEKWINDSILQKADSATLNLIEHLCILPKATAASKRIFIAHGNSEEAKKTIKVLERYCSDKGLAKPIVLYKEPDNGKTLIELVEEGARSACFAVVIYTPCDIGKQRDASGAEYKPRVRQNVMFEHGYLCAELGRDKVAVLYNEGVEIPSDLGGLRFIKFDAFGEWMIELTQRLESSGVLQR